MPAGEFGAFAEWLFLTGYGNAPDSVRALRLGAYDFLEKPCDLDRLDLLVASALRSAAIQRRVADQPKPTSFSWWLLVIINFTRQLHPVMIAFTTTHIVSSHSTYG